MATLEDMKTVYDLPPDDDPKYDEKKRILLWYFDIYLPAATGKEAYGPTVRYYKRSTKGCKVAGEGMAVIPQEVEAFGLLLFENCLPKWKHICPKKAEDPTWSVSQLDRNDKANEKYHETKWTDGKTGQVQGGGWSQEGYDAFNSYIMHISKIREEDKKNQWAVHELALQLMRDEHGITDTKKSAPKKRKKGGKASNQLEDFQSGPKWEQPEVEDTWSVGSEDSSGERDQPIVGVDDMQE